MAGQIAGEIAAQGLRNFLQQIISCFPAAGSVVKFEIGEIEIHGAVHAELSPILICLRRLQRLLQEHRMGQEPRQWIPEGQRRNHLFRHQAQDPHRPRLRKHRLCQRSLQTAEMTVPGTAVKGYIILPLPHLPGRRSVHLRKRPVLRNLHHTPEGAAGKGQKLLEAVALVHANQ